MAWKKDIPTAVTMLAVSQDDLLKNFGAIDTFVNVNHEAFGETDNKQGKHKYVFFPKQSSSPTTPADEVALFCKDNAAGDPALLFKPHSDGTEVDFTTCGKADTGWTRVPSGIMFKWGRGLVGPNTSAQATFDATVVFTDLYVVNVSLGFAAGMDKNLFINSFSNTTLSVYNANATIGMRTFYYFAIGI